jgi:hypothetical protein
MSRGLKSTDLAGQKISTLASPSNIQETAHEVNAKNIAVMTGVLHLAENFNVIPFQLRKAR